MSRSHASSHSDEIRTKKIRGGAAAALRSVRHTRGVEFTNPRVGFAFADLLEELAKAAGAGIIDHRVCNAAIRASAAIVEIEQQQRGATVLVKCSCGRHFRISGEILSVGRITCELCDTGFRVVSGRLDEPADWSDPSESNKEKSNASRVGKTRGRIERSP